MNKTVLKIRLDSSFKNAVVMQILEQDSDLLEPIIMKDFISRNGQGIFMVSKPCLTQQEIYLRGTNKASDLCPAAMLCDNPTEYITKAIEALTEAVQSVVPSREPQMGEAVLVRDYDSDNWELRIFGGYCEKGNTEYRFRMVGCYDAENFILGKRYGTVDWRQMRYRNQMPVTVTRDGDVWTIRVKENE